MAEQQQQRHSPNKRALAREVRRQRQGSRKRRRRILFTSVAVFFALALIISLIIPSFPFQNRGGGASLPPSGPGLRISDLGTHHIDPGEAHPSYNSIPPTSGWHYQNQIAPWGAHRVQLADEVYLHNLEHGGIAIQYDTDDGKLIAQLEEFADIQHGFPSCFIVAPYGPMAAPVALTAWGAIQYFETFDAQGMQAFVDAYRNKGPELITATDCG